MTTWFAESQIEMNKEYYQCPLLMFGGNREPVTLDLGSVKVNRSKEETLLGMIADKGLNFNA